MTYQPLLFILSLKFSVVSFERWVILHKYGLDLLKRTLPMDGQCPLGLISVVQVIGRHP